MWETTVKMSTEDAMIWVIIWFLIICVFLTSNASLVVLELLLICGIGITFKYFKYKEKKNEKV